MIYHSVSFSPNRKLVMRALRILGFGLMLIGYEKIILSPVLTGPSDIAAAAMTATNLVLFVVPGLVLMWYGE